jgi:hypothetical protein
MGVLFAKFLVRKYTAVGVVMSGAGLSLAELLLRPPVSWLPRLGFVIRCALHH